MKWSINDEIRNGMIELTLPREWEMLLNKQKQLFVTKETRKPNKSHTKT